MKLLHTIRSLDPRDGGVVGMTRDLVRAGLRRGHAAEVCTLDSPDAPWLHEWPGRVHAIGPARGTYGYTPRLTPWMAVHGGFYDGIVLHGLWQFSSFGAWRGLARLESPPPYLIFPHGMLDGWFKENEPLKHLKKTLYWPLEHAVLRRAAAVCFTTEEERIRSSGVFSPYEAHDVVAGAGIETPVLAAANDLSTFVDDFFDLNGKRFVLFLGRIHPKKGCDLLARAFGTVAASSPDLHLVFAGPDPSHWEPELLAMVPVAARPRVHFTGMLQGGRKWAILRAADAFIIPSHQENFCLAAAEALACGVPVLASDQVNIWREIVTNGAGLVQPDTVEGTVALLRQWEALPIAEKKRMRAEARDCFEKHFSIETVYETLLALVTPQAQQAAHP